MSLQPHLKCKEGDVSKYVLLPGDPKRVLKIVEFFDKAEKVAENREMLTYRGTYKGLDLTVTSTGMGCPSAAIALEELANIGAEVFVRIGTCGTLKEGINYGDIIIPTAAIRAEGTTKEYIEPEFPAVADLDVLNSLIASAKENNIPHHVGINRTHDAFYEHLDNMLRWGNIFKDKRMSTWPSPVVSSEMECSAVFLIAHLRGLKAGAVLAVNTLEPLNKIVEDPDLIYHLEESPDAAKGLDRAIQTALDGLVIFDKKSKK